jgi:hypothetical protein
MNGKQCPNCDNRGYFIGGYYQEPEAVKCEFCYTVPDSIFNIKEQERILKKKLEIICKE